MTTILFMIMFLLTCNNLLLLLAIRKISMINSKLITISKGTTNLSKNFGYNHVKTLKLPVWPIVGGVLTQVADFLPNKAIVEGFLSSIGGRVIPMSLSSSPFLLLVHHTHSFTSFDPFRTLTSILLPEGFPAHPHAGFDTVTYCTEGGLKHRDSEGCKMSYGDGDIQWMRAGKGIIHEEMWNINNEKIINHQKIELFQLWINLPNKMKENEPIVKVITSNTIPIIKCGDNRETIKLLAGNVEFDNTLYEGPGNEIAGSDITLLHMNIPNEKSSISLTLPNNQQSICIYIRRGSIITNKEEIHLGDMLIIDPTTSFSITSGNRGVDCLVLIGEQLNEPAVTNGPFVQVSDENINKKATIFSSIGREGYWDYRLPDNEWLDHCKKLRLQELLNE